MKILGKNFNVRRFRILEGKPTEEQFFAGIKHYSRNILELEKSAEITHGAFYFQPVHDAMISIDKKEDIIMNDVVVFAYVKAKKKANAGVIDYELAKAIKEKSDKLGSPAFLSRAEKSHIKEKLNLEATPEFKAIPVMIDFNSNTGYIFSPSETIYNEVVEELISLFSMESGLVVSELPAYDNIEFQTWLWWRIENNPTKSVDNAEIVLDGEVEVFDPANASERVVCKTAACEECRLALLRGMQTSKLCTAFVADGKAKRVILNGPYQTGFKDITDGAFKDTELPHYYDLRAELERLYIMLSSLQKEFDETGGYNNTMIDTWARGDFCSRSFDGV